MKGDTDELRLRQALRVIQTWTGFDDSSKETRQKAMSDINKLCKNALKTEQERSDDE